MLPTLNKHHKIVYLYLKHILGHKKNQTFVIYVPSINSVEMVCF